VKSHELKKKIYVLFSLNFAWNGTILLIFK